MSEIYSVMDQIDFWHWWILAAVFLAIEVFAPTTLFLWTGISAAVVGIVAYFADGLSWQIQFLLFAILSVASVFAWRAIARSRQSAEDEPLLNRRGKARCVSTIRSGRLPAMIAHRENAFGLRDWTGTYCKSKKPKPYRF